MDTLLQEAGVSDSNTSVMGYMIYLYPIVMSCGLGGSIIGAIFWIGSWIWKRISSALWSTVTINYDDESFKNVLKYLKDKDLLTSDNILFGKIKRSDEPWWETIFR